MPSRQNLNETTETSANADSDHYIFFFFQAEDGIRDLTVTGVQTCALPISTKSNGASGCCATRPRAGSACSCARCCAGSAREPSARQVGPRSARWPRRTGPRDRKSVVEGKSVDLGGRRIIKKKKQKKKGYVD